MGAILAIRLTETLTMELDTPIHRIIIWSDSAIVLQWIGKSSSGYHAFVGNRINKIDDGLTRLLEKLQTKEVYFRYISTDLNPADDATRGLKLPQVMADSRWQKGPSFLLQPEDAWPERRFESVQEPSEEVKQVKWVGLLWKDMDANIFHSTKYSSLAKLHRIVAYCFRFIRNARQPCHSQASGALKVSEMIAAKRTLLKRAQAESFSKEIAALEKGSPIPSRSRILKLNPRLEDGLLVVGVRLNYAPIRHVTKHPIILDGKHDLSRLLVDEYHRMYRQPGADNLL